jgi:predicted DNA-binding transcriptional regulator YafY
MGHASATEKAERLNHARQVLADVNRMPEAVDRMMRECGLSRRQAYRYVQEALELTAPVHVPGVKVPFTVTVPQRVIRALRAHAEATGLSLSEIVSRAIVALLARSRRRG